MIPLSTRTPSQGDLDIHHVRTDTICSLQAKNDAPTKEQDLFLPKENVRKVMRDVLPPGSLIARDAVTVGSSFSLSSDMTQCMQECLTEFILFTLGEYPFHHPSSASSSFSSLLKSWRDRTEREEICGQGEPHGFSSTVSLYMSISSHNGQSPGIRQLRQSLIYVSGQTRRTSEDGGTTEEEDNGQDI